MIILGVKKFTGGWEMKDNCIWLKIEPLDVLLFRDGRPFSAGEDHHATSLFPPNPSTVSGAIRTYLMRSGILEDVGDAENSPIQFLGPMVMRGDRIYVRCPLDVYVPKRGDKTPVLAEELSISLSFKCSGSGMMWCYTPQEVKPASGFVALDDMVEWQKRDIDNWTKKSILEEKEFIMRDTRVGIKLSSSGTVESGKLYTVEYVVFREGVSLLVGLSPGAVEEFKKCKEHFEECCEGLIPLGGERRFASFTLVDVDPHSHISKQSGNRGALITPLVGGIPGCGVYAGRTTFIGGWDYAKGEPKVLRSALKPGGVLWSEDGFDGELNLRCHPNAFMSSIGYGMMVIGR